MEHSKAPRRAPGETLLEYRARYRKWIIRMGATPQEDRATVRNLPSRFEFPDHDPSERYNMRFQRMQPQDGSRAIVAALDIIRAHQYRHQMEDMP